MEADGTLVLEQGVGVVCWVGVVYWDWKGGGGCEWVSVGAVCRFVGKLILDTGRGVLDIWLTDRTEARPDTTRYRVYGLQFWATEQ